MVDTNVLFDSILALLESKKYASLRDLLSTLNPADVASLFGDMPEEKLPVLFRLLPKEQAAETFVEMESDHQEMLIRGFSDNELKEVIDELYVDDAADLVEEMPANVVKRILRQADPDMRKKINEILKYPEDSAGSIMTTEYVTLRPSMHVGEAFKHIRRTGVDKETIYTCYVTRDDKVLIGFVTIKDLIFADEEDLIRDIMDENVISVKTADDQEEVAMMLSKYNFVALPVVDREDRIVGIVTVDDAMDVMEKEATEDMELLAAMTPNEKPYLRQGVIETWKARVPWLMLLMLSATFTGMIITKFEDSLAACVVLTAFIPMLMGTGGNSGSQASVAVIRSLSLGETEFSDILQVIWKEIRVSVMCGGVLAVANFGKMLLVDKLLLGNPDVTIMVAAVVCITLFCTVVCAKTVGCSLPLLAQKVGCDPAVMANPLITTIIDTLSLVIYFVWATHLLGI